MRELKDKHKKLVPSIMKHFNLDDSFIILKDYQVFDENTKGNWLVMKKGKICFIIYREYVKKLFGE